MNEDHIGAGWLILTDCPTSSPVTASFTNNHHVPAPACHDSVVNCVVESYDPDVLLDEVLKISKKYKKTIYRFKLLNAILLLNLVDKYFKKYNINNNDNHYIVKKNILDAYTFCNTYKIFPGLEKHLLDEYKLDYKLPKQSIQFSDKIKSLI